MDSEKTALKRVISLPLLVLYGLGVSIGAGIYVLIGEAAAQAGYYTPMAFVLAAIVMFFIASSFAELSGRLPKSAGEAVYVKAGFGSDKLALFTGSIVLLSAAVSAAAITIGGVGYLMELIPIPRAAMIVAVVVVMGGIAAWGVKESVVFAAIFTVLEVLGLLVIIAAGLWTNPDILTRLPEVVPSLSDTAAMAAIFSTSLIAFFAFIGFDDIVNLVEEAKNPAKTVPKAIYLTLGITTLLYFMVATVAVFSVPLDELGTSTAPVGLLFERLTGSSPLIITLIAVVATLNGIVLQIIMGARVLYGMAESGTIPIVFGKVNARTGTPLLSTFLITVSILMLALFFPIGALAAFTSQLLLVVFTLACIALILLKLRKIPAPFDCYTVGIWQPVFGTIGCLALLIGPLLMK